MLFRRTIAVVLLLLVAGCSKPQQAAVQPTQPTQPNIVFVLTDDLSMNLLQYMPQAQQLAKDGASFSNYTVTDSLCCPSRSSIFTGKFPHDTGVFTNGGKDGGFKVFHQRQNEDSTFATALQKAGYHAAMMGKYLNGYQPDGTVDGQQNYVPPGWNDWYVAGNGYNEYNYTLNANHQLEKHGKAPNDYLTDVLAGKAHGVITSAKQPFFLEIATFAPHAPYTPAPQDKKKFPGLKAPRDASYDKLPANAPPWLAKHPALTPKQQKALDKAFRKRVQAVQAVDRMIGSLRATLEQAGVADHTVVVFSSDNGYHLGEHRLTAGKQTAFETDVHVPLVMAGPGIKAGSTVPQSVQNVDLAPTFETLAGLTPAADVDGRSLTALFGGTPPAGWRTASLVEHHGPDIDRKDPDYPPKGSGNPTTYEALRTATSTYVEYSDGTVEYYDRTKDPLQLDNTAGSLPAAKKTQLHNALHALKTCHNETACTKAGRMAG
ncbi:sulfatase [Kribbella sp.]|uniref:sulfatase family protein n=1 Tax=Kribbella sp. TaxID=1871183 RepID=UPI002D70A0B8|nr:sulfatase [Kribbella sp.]HZX02512.1 sulfatase [Kribbella sp.]